MARFGCMGYYQEVGRFIQESKALNPLRLHVAIPRSSTLLGNEPVVDYSYFKFTDQVNRWNWQIILTPTLEPPSLNLMFYRWSLKEKKFVITEDNLLTKLDITLVYSFDRTHEIVWSRERFFFKSPRSCLLPKTEFLLHVFEVDSFLRP